MNIKDCKIKSLGGRNHKSIQFNDNGDVSESEISGNYIEDMKNEVISVDKTNKLNIKKNTMCGNKGNNIVLKRSKDINVESNTIQDVRPNSLSEENRSPAGIVVE